MASKILDYHDDRRYDELRDERNNLYIDAIPYLEEALKIDPSNFNAAKTFVWFKLK